MSAYTDAIAVDGPASVMPAHILAAPNHQFSVSYNLWTYAAPDNTSVLAEMMVTAPRIPVAVPIIVHDGPITFAYLPAAYYDHLSAPIAPTAGAGAC